MGTSEAPAEQPPTDSGIPAPLLLGGMAREGWRLYRKAFFPIVWVYLAIFLILAAILNVAIYGMNETESGQVLVYLLVVVIGQQVGASLATAVAHLYFTDKALGRDVRLRDSFSEVRSIATPVLLASLFSALLALVGGIVLPHPLVQIVFGYWFLGPPILITIVLLETRRMSGSSKRFGELMRGEWLRIPMYLLSFALGAAMLQVVATGLAIVSVAQGAENLNDITVLAGVAVLAAGTIVRCVVLPFLAAVWLVAYFDLRARKDNLDRRGLAKLRPAPQQ